MLLGNVASLVHFVPELFLVAAIVLLILVGLATDDELGAGRGGVDRRGR